MPTQNNKSDAVQITTERCGNPSVQNLPTSFDVSALVDKLLQLESELRNHDVIQRVRIIELDPHKKININEVDEEATRLFLAVAYGKHVVLAQMFELALRHVIRDEGCVDDYGDMGTCCDENLEWVEISKNGTDNYEEHQCQQSNSSANVAVIFPPTWADKLPLHSNVKNNNNNSNATLSDATNDLNNWNAKITSCEIFPSPAITVTGLYDDCDDQSHMQIIQRTVGVVIGTSFGQVYSIPIHISDQVASSDDDDKVHFFFEYDKCETTNKAGDENHHPIVLQILPRKVNVRCHDDDNGSTCDREDNTIHAVDADVQVFHPLVVRHETNENFEETSANVGIKALTFRRDDATRNVFHEETVALHRDMVWVTYENGTIVKLPSWKLFSSVLRADWNDTKSAFTSDEMRDVSSGTPFTAIPLNGNTKSPLDIPPAYQPNTLQSKTDESGMAKERLGDYWSMLTSAIESTIPTQGSANQPTESALIIAGQSMAVSTMPFQINSSRVHGITPSTNEPKDNKKEIQSPTHNEDNELDYDSVASSTDEMYGPATGAVLGGTKALMKGAIGVAVDAMRWGLGRTVGNKYVRGYEDDEEFMDVADNVNQEEASNITAAMPPSSQDTTKKSNIRGPLMEEKRVHDLFPYPLNGLSFLFCDLPRRFESAKVDPSGTMAVTTDNLGRVMLFDLETHQPIRMWKGMRNVSCHFTEVWNGEEEGSRKQIYLVIHFQRKGMVEIYRLRQGPRVSLVAVTDHNHCAVLECSGPPSNGSRVESFLLEVISDGGGGGGEYQYIIDNLIIDDPDVAANSSTRTQSTNPASQNTRTMQLNLFIQILSSDTNVPCSAATLLATFKQIKTLADLGEGLEALSKCHRLEEDMGIVGSSFHSQAVAHCKSRIDQVKKTESEEGSGMARKTAISDLSSKLSYHERLINAFDILNNFELKDDLNNTVMDDDTSDLRSLSSWASEALSWLVVASGNVAACGRFAPAFPSTNQQNNKPLRFSAFAMSCSASNSKNKPPFRDNDVVYFTPVKRDRAQIISRIFRPLLRDLFVFKVVNSILNHLGINGDYDTLQLYFGEWLLSLPSDTIKANMSGNWRPMVRWLHDMILNAHQKNRQNAQELDDASLESIVKLESLLNFCNEIEDLPKVFLISVICIDAVSTASLQIEEKTYGKITQLDCIRPWENLMRKLRVCLLVSLRLSGDVDSLGGFNPMTVRSVSKPDTFSAYAWIARDELTLSHENEVLMAMETAYLSSSEAFYPSTADGDTVLHKKAILQSCSNAQRGSLRHPSGLTSDSLSAPLLFYLKDYGRFTSRLAAHRALILIGLWGQTPDNMLLLTRCIESLQIVNENADQFSLATLVEIWQSRIRPVCQAVMFGFHDVPELSQEVFSPLIENQVWLSKFASHARAVLGMIVEQCTSGNPIQVTLDENIFSQDNEMWPPLRECPVLIALVSKLRPVNSSSVMLHHIVAFTFEMTHDIDSIASAVPSFSRLFSVGSLFSEMPPMPKESIEQRGLIDQAIFDRAKNSLSIPVIDNFDCVKDVELVGRAFGLNPKYAKTRYLIEIIRVGRDASINDLLGSSSGALMKPLFIKEVIQILCTRLHGTISSLKRTKHYRGVVSRLDADSCNWVKEQAELGRTHDDEYNTPVSLITTHSLILRVRNMVENNTDSKQSINALSLISETLLKAVREQEQELLINV